MHGRSRSRRRKRGGGSRGPRTSSCTGRVLSPAVTGASSLFGGAARFEMARRLCFFSSISAVVISAVAICAFSSCMSLAVLPVGLMESSSIQAGFQCFNYVLLLARFAFSMRISCSSEALVGMDVDPSICRGCSHNDDAPIGVEAAPEPASTTFLVAAPSPSLELSASLARKSAWSQTPFKLMAAGVILLIVVALLLPTTSRAAFGLRPHATKSAGQAMLGPCCRLHVLLLPPRMPCETGPHHAVEQFSIENRLKTPKNFRLRRNFFACGGQKSRVKNFRLHIHWRPLT